MLTTTEECLPLRPQQFTVRKQEQRRITALLLAACTSVFPSRPRP